MALPMAFLVVTLALGLGLPALEVVGLVEDEGIVGRGGTGGGGGKSPGRVGAACQMGTAAGRGGEDGAGARARVRGALIMRLDLWTIFWGGAAMDKSRGECIKRAPSWELWGWGEVTPGPGYGVAHAVRAAEDVESSEDEAWGGLALMSRESSRLVTYDSLRL